MKSVRVIAAILYYLSRVAAFIFLAIIFYATIVVLAYYAGADGVPVEVSNQNAFQIFYPFTRMPLLLGEYTASYIVTYFSTMAFYGVFLLLLSGVFQAFKGPRLFTQKRVLRLSRFYVTNLLVPFLFLLLIVVFRDQASDFVRIIFLHLVIGVFAFFMAAIFKQGLVLQEEQDLIF